MQYCQCRTISNNCFEHLCCLREHCYTCITLRGTVIFWLGDEGWPMLNVENRRGERTTKTAQKFILIVLYRKTWPHGLLVSAPRSEGVQTHVLQISSRIHRSLNRGIGQLRHVAVVRQPLYAGVDFIPQSRIFEFGYWRLGALTIWLASRC